MSTVALESEPETEIRSSTSVEFSFNFSTPALPPTRIIAVEPAPVRSVVPGSSRVLLLSGCGAASAAE